MPVLDIEALLLPAREDPPCGPDLSYDPKAVELAIAMSGRPEQQWGDLVVPAVPPDWAVAQVLATDLLTRSKDLVFGVTLTRAATRLSGMAGCADGLELLLGLMQRHWAGLHPVDPDEPEMVRALTLDALSSHDGLLGDLIALRPVAELAPDAMAEEEGERRRAAAAVQQITQLWRRLAPDVSLDLTLLRRELVGVAGAQTDPAEPDSTPVGSSRVAADLPGAQAALDQALAWIAQHRAQPAEPA